LIFTLFTSYYQDDLRTPGTFPSLDNSRKQIRQMPKSLMNPWRRPHLKQRFTVRVLNFGFFCALTLTDVFAINKNEAL